MMSWSSSCSAGSRRPAVAAEQRDVARLAPGRRERAVEPHDVVVGVAARGGHEAHARALAPARARGRSRRAAGCPASIENPPPPKATICTRAERGAAPRGRVFRPRGPDRDRRQVPVQTGVALLGERRRALARVVRREHRAGDLALLAPRTPRWSQSRCRCEDLLGRHERERRVLARSAPASSSAASTAPPGSASAVDEPELVRALGGDRVAGERELHRDAVRARAAAGAAARRRRRRASA